MEKHKSTNNRIDCHSKLSCYPLTRSWAPQQLPKGFGNLWPARFHHKTSRNSPKLKDNFPIPPLLQPAQMPSSPLNLLVVISSRCSPLCRGCLDALDPLKFQLWPWLRAGSLPLLFPSLSTSIMESQSSPGHGHHLHQQQDGRADGWGAQEMGEDGRTSGRS